VSVAAGLGVAEAPAGGGVAAAPDTAPVPVLVLGGSGYVAGEALRLLAGHPRLAVAGVLSESQHGHEVGEAFPHLAACYRGVLFSPMDDLARLLDAAVLPPPPRVGDRRPAPAAGPDGARPGEDAGRSRTVPLAVTAVSAASAAPGATTPRVAAICAAPHGAAAMQIDRLLQAAERAGIALRVVDLSADFRFATAAEYERVYGHPHGAPARLAAFACAVPEHAGLAFAGAAATATAIAGPVHLGHPGCFPTAVLLAAVPLVRLGWIEPTVHVVAVTGSTGAGRTPSATTHHPARRSNLFAYNPLAHRHEPEMRALAAAAAGEPVAVHFVPQAGPFARGIYATLQARLRRPRGTPHASGAGSDRELAAEVAADLARFYAASPFVDVLAEPPRLQDVVGTNRCRIAVAVADDRLVAFSAIDNLTKGAAGGGIQWLNRQLGFGEDAGLTQPGIGWL
jgi:N-acetyl-gamma-glutamyl-phosphate reductase common form